MKRYLKILLACICRAVDLLAAGCAAIIGIPPRERLVVLYYHEVTAAKRAGFARQMDALAHRARIVAANWGGDGKGGLACAVTFDDAFVSVLENALPEMVARDIPCTIFVPVGLLGRAPEWAMENPVAAGEVVAGEDALRALPSGLVTIGAHSVTHPRLSRISCNAARAEVEQSRALLTEICGRDVTLFAFPYGDHDEEVVGMCRASGYRFVYSNMPHVVDLPSDQFVRGRVSVEPGDGRLEFFLKMAGAYRWLPAISALKRWLGLTRPQPADRRADLPGYPAAGK